MLEKKQKQTKKKPQQTKPNQNKTKKQPKTTLWSFHKGMKFTVLF